MSLLSNIKFKLDSKQSAIEFEVDTMGPGEEQ